MEDINYIHDGIMRKLESGPSLILEIAESIGKDTLQTQTITDYFVSRGEIKKTQRKFGSSPVYYLDRDKDKALNILLQTLNNQEKALVNKVRAEKVLNTAMLSSAERYISQNLTDFTKKVSAQDNQTGEKADYLYEQGLSLDDVKRIINEKTGVKENTRTERQSKPVSDSAKKTAGPSDVSELLERNGFKNPKNVEKDVFLCDYGRNDTKVIVQVVQKKSLGKRDFIRAMGYGSAYKTITFIITNAQKVVGSKSFGSMVNIVRDEL